MNLLKLAFNATKKELLDTINKFSNLHVPKDDPRAIQGLEICKELVENSVNDLERSMNSVNGIELKELDQLMENLKVWISGALTYQETCFDAFENSTSNVGQMMKNLLKTSKELISDTLSIVSMLSSLKSSFDVKRVFHHRRLMDDSKPKVASESQKLLAWINDQTRHIMKLPTTKIRPNVTVALDGSGQYKTIMEAINRVPNNNVEAFVIYIKEGVYKEHVIVDKSNTNVIFIGDGHSKTKITGNKNFVDGYQTFKTSTVDIIGDGFMAKDIGFENSAGPTKHQAMAIRLVSDFSTFYNCRFDGYQDTLYAVRSRQFYRHCTITGTIDFIFGDAMAIFQNCKMAIRKPLENQQCIVTAQGRLQSDGPGAFILQNCTINADPDYYPVKDKNRAFLGRPWKDYSRTIIMQSFIDEAIHYEGWAPWSGDFGLDTLFYVEFENRGPGAAKEKRVKWNGVKQLSSAQVQDFTISKFYVNASSWLNTTGVPHYSTMLNI
ncbi:pectinesterase-like [Chenopodium quinoa]|uniref:Pectinesterase n=1 Tax=Chenopodium quinoa TaxID=63459 RepID=A0A803LLT5_CHEQI|nr:pectinesterase-like [Chenopodium quinoa]